MVFLPVDDEVPLAVRVGPARFAVRAHALRVGNRLLVGRRSCRDGRATGAACRYQQGGARHGGCQGASSPPAATAACVVGHVAVLKARLLITSATIIGHGNQDAAGNACEFSVSNARPRRRPECPTQARPLPAAAGTGVPVNSCSPYGSLDDCASRSSAPGVSGRYRGHGCSGLLAGCLVSRDGTAHNPPAPV